MFYICFLLYVYENLTKYITSFLFPSFHSPTPQITWSRRGNKEIPLDRIKNGNGPNGATLQIRDVDFDDDGVYICEASNGEGGPITYESTVTVRCKYTSPQILYIVAGQEKPHVHLAPEHVFTIKYLRGNE